jgi:hypothetical protein
MHETRTNLRSIDLQALELVSGGEQQCKYTVRVRPWGPTYQQTCTRSEYAKCLDTLPKGYTAKDMRETCGQPR